MVERLRVTLWFSKGDAGVSDADESDTIRGQVTAAIALSGPFLLTH